MRRLRSACRLCYWLPAISQSAANIVSKPSRVPVPSTAVVDDDGMEHWNHPFKHHLATAGGNVASSTIIRTSQHWMRLLIGLMKLQTSHHKQSTIPQRVQNKMKTNARSTPQQVYIKYLEWKDLISIFHHFLGTTSLVLTRKSLKNGFKGT